MSKSSLQDGAVYDAKSLGAGRVIVLGFQHMFAMFGSTVLVPILTGLSVSATLLFAGLGTLLFHLVSKRKVPAFLGSSFAFLAGYFALAPHGESQLLPYGVFSGLFLPYGGLSFWCHLVFTPRRMRGSR